MTAVVAVLLTLGAMNAYFAGAAKLGSALGRDRAMPVWLARGSSAGEVPRRSLLVVGALALVSLGATAVLHLELTTIMLLTTGSFTLVYLLGSAAAIKLLPPGSWSRRGAVVALLSALLLAVSTGASTLWALGVCAAAATYVAVRDRRA